MKYQRRHLICTTIDVPLIQYYDNDRKINSTSYCLVLAKNMAYIRKFPQFIYACVHLDSRHQRQTAVVLSNED